MTLNGKETWWNQVCLAHYIINYPSAEAESFIHQHMPRTQYKDCLNWQTPAEWMTAWASPYLSSAQIRGWAHTWGVALLPGDHSWKHVTPVTCSPKVLSAQGRQVPGPTIFWELKANSRNVNWGNQDSHTVRWLWRRRPGANWYLTSAHQGHAGGHGYSSITAPSNSWLPSRSVFRVGASSESERLPRRTTTPGMHCSSPNPCRKAGPRKEAATSPGPRVPRFSFRHRASPQPRTEYFRGSETAARAKALPPLQESPGRRSQTNFLSGFGARRAVSDGMQGVGIPAREDPAAAPEASRLGRLWRRSPWCLRG